MNAKSNAGLVTELRSLGHAVLPAPRQVELAGGAVKVDQGWSVTPADVAGDDIAVTTLRDRAREELGLDLCDGGGGKTIRLAVEAGAVDTRTADGRDAQAYRLTIGTDGVEVVGNAAPGLYYGVQTLLQLLQGRRRGILPLGRIVDWPRYELRFVHWDTKHHQDTIATLRRFLDWMGRFKLNAVSFELEDKFEYPSHPIVGAPGAFTAAQLQELVDYGLARHIQIVPNIQAPAHLAFALKHEQFAHLRCDGSNYMACMDDPEARQLIFDLYDDVCDATEGVDYLHVSTDEIYYAGICQKYRKPYHPQNRSLTWVDFVRAAHEHLARRGRRVLIWAEFPLLPEHVHMLPADIIDGILSPGKDAPMVRAEHELGMRQLAYCPIQGAEVLFPNHFGWLDEQGRRHEGHLAGAYETTLRPHAEKADVIGTFAASWDDAGLHNETFWLGWAVMAQGSWTPGDVSWRQTAAEFMDIYYGPDVDEMVEVYRDLQAQARFWEQSWDDRPSTARPEPGYGSSRGKHPVTRTDMTLLPPGLPKLPELSYEPTFSHRYRPLLDRVPRMLADSDRLLGRLHRNVAAVERNAYNLEVLLSLAEFTRRHLEMLAAVAAAEDQLAQASRAAAEGNAGRATGLMVAARRTVGSAIDGVQETFARLEAVWEKSRRPRNAPADGREFIHVFDDVKDHFADRRADLSYHIAPFESMHLTDWRAGLEKVIRQYADQTGQRVTALDQELMDD